MPRMHGVELQKRLLQSGRETPIVFISGESQPQEIVTAIKQGSIEFLLKPFGMAALLHASKKGWPATVRFIANWYEPSKSARATSA